MRPSQTVMISNLTKDSLSVATGIVAIVETALAISGISFRDIIPDQPWWVYLLVVVAVFVVLVLVVHFALANLYRRRIELDINDNTVEVFDGDLFAQEGMKVIPFNEHFDTKVDDVVISHTSLNGIFIDRYVNDLEELRRAIENDCSSPLPVEKIESGFRYELGTLKRFGEDYLLLSFARFDELNQAHLTMVDYERCLMNMWRELQRVYAGRPIVLPLLGSGITRFDDVRGKSENELLKCMLCTLRSTGYSFKEPIRIVLTRRVIEKIKLYEMKGVTRYGI